ncbi:hypothetical protein KBI23_18580 [bacterium]|nr:hypothetical protein [bacterium]
MFAKVKLIVSALRRRLFLMHRGDSSPLPTDPNCLPFASLSRQEQFVVTQYLISVSELVSLVNCIQSRGRAVDHDLVLANFAKGEAAYVAAGFMPFMPGAIMASGLTSLEPQAIDRSLLLRRSTGDNYACFAAVMRQQVERLLRSGKVIKLDSQVAERRLKELCEASRPDNSRP